MFTRRSLPKFPPPTRSRPASCSALHPLKVHSLCQHESKSIVAENLHKRGRPYDNRRSYWSNSQPLTTPTGSSSPRSCEFDPTLFTSRRVSSLHKSKINARRGYSTGEGQQSSSREAHSDSIFSPNQSPWDHVFEDIKELPPLLPASTRRLKKPSYSPPTTEMKRTRRQTMTAREISAFDEMFNMIFNAVSQHKAEGRLNPGAPDDIAIGLGPQVGSGAKTRREMSDLFGTLRRHSKRLKWTTATDEELDRKKEEMELCDTDQQLLEWAMREVFGESRKHEEAARKAVEQVARGEESKPMPVLQHPAYPHLISILMRTFRDKYHDPHLTLSIFDYARHLSIPSYVFGCTAPAYNELIETRWSCFRDLRGILEALEEMRVNGVEPDNRTRKLVEDIRREAGQKVLWEEEDYMGGGSHVLDVLNRVEALVAREPPSDPKKSRKFKNSTQRSGKLWNDWKNKAGDEYDDWQFGKWDESPSLAR